MLLSGFVKVEVARFKASRDKRGSSKAEEWTDAASRSDKRYEVKFPLKAPFTDPGFVTNRFLLGFAKCMLSSRYRSQFEPWKR